MAKYLVDTYLIANLIFKLLLREQPSAWQWMGQIGSLDSRKSMSWWSQLFITDFLSLYYSNCIFSQPQKKKIKRENMNCRLLSLKTNQNILYRFTKSDCGLKLLSELQKRTDWILRINVRPRLKGWKVFCVGFSGFYLGIFDQLLFSTNTSLFRSRNKEISVGYISRFMLMNVFAELYFHQTVLLHLWICWQVDCNSLNQFELRVLFVHIYW